MEYVGRGNDLKIGKDAIALEQTPMYTHDCN